MTTPSDPPGGGRPAGAQTPAPPRWRPRRPAPSRPELTLDQLHTFLAVAEREHVGEAAAALGISQGSVSAVVRRLERTLGLPLFQRVGRNIRLTDVGRELRPMATRVLDELALIDELRTSYLSTRRGEVAIAAGHVVGAHRAPGWLAAFVTAHPEIALHLTLASYRVIVTMLRDGEADIIFAGSAVEAPGVETLVMERAEMVLVVAASHPLARSRAPLRELNRHRHLCHGPGSATRQLADRLLDGRAEDAETVDLEAGALIAALGAGLGFAVLARVLVERDLATGRLVVLPSPGPRVVQAFTAARRSSGHTPAVSLLWDHLLEVAARPALPEGDGGSEVARPGRMHWP